MVVNHCIHSVRGKVGVIYVSAIDQLTIWTHLFWYRAVEQRNSFPSKVDSCRNAHTSGSTGYGDRSRTFAVGTLAQQDRLAEALGKVGPTRPVADKLWGNLAQEPTSKKRQRNATLKCLKFKLFASGRFRNADWSGTKIGGVHFLCSSIHFSHIIKSEKSKALRVAVCIEHNLLVSRVRNY